MTKVLAEHDALVQKGEKKALDEEKITITLHATSEDSNHDLT